MRKFTLFLAAFLSCTMTVNAAPEGALPGLFSVAEGKQVFFSKGNLQIKPYEYLWRFAPYQYEMAGADNALIAGSAGVFIDLFGWATSGWVLSTAVAHMPWDASTNDEDYILGNDFHNGMTGEFANADWGVENAISNGGNKAGLWRTPTYDEWDYLLFGRPDAEAKHALASVGSVHGLVILPDNWTMPEGLHWNPAATDYTTNRYAQSRTEWDKMEAAGALFLPCAGQRTGQEVNGVNVFGCYWGADYFDSNTATGVTFDNMVNLTGLYRSQGHAVRLIQDLPAQGIDQINHKSEIINHKFIKNGQLLIDRNGKTYNAQGALVE